MVVQNEIGEIEAAIALLRKSGYLVARKMGVEAAGYFPYVNQSNIFQPWREHPQIGFVAQQLGAHGARTLVPRDRLYVIHQLLVNTLGLQGEIWEAGVYQGGSALLICEELRRRGILDAIVRLFDTYEGMPETHPEFDLHKQGAFADTSLAQVMKLVGSDDFIHYHKGLVPATFDGLSCDMIRFAHVDLDIYEPIKASCEFIWPRLVRGGSIVFDDYGYASCPGAKKAVDEYFAQQPLKPLVLPTGQAVIVKP